MRSLSPDVDRAPAPDDVWRRAGPRAVGVLAGTLAGLVVVMAMGALLGMPRSMLVGSGMVALLGASVGAGLWVGLLGNLGASARSPSAAGAEALSFPGSFAGEVELLVDPSGPLVSTGRQRRGAEPLAVWALVVSPASGDALAALVGAVPRAPLHVLAHRALGSSVLHLLTTTGHLAVLAPLVVAHFRAVLHARGEGEVLRGGLVVVPYDALLEHAEPLSVRAAALAEPGEFHWHDADIPARLVRLEALRRELRPALIAGDITAVFQPMFAADDLGLEAVELLARWNHAERGAIPPEDFLAQARGQGVLRDLTGRMLVRACRLHARWRREGRASVPLVVNAGVDELLDPLFARFARRTLWGHGVPAGAIWIDVDAAELTAVPGDLAVALRPLTEAGLRLVVDGVRSSIELERLRTLPLVAVKLDVGERSDSGATALEALVASVSARAFTVHLKRVGTTDQLTEVRRLPGVSLVQGFALSEPLDEAAVSALLRPAPGADVVTDDASGSLPPAPPPAPRRAPVEVVRTRGRRRVPRGGRRNGRTSGAHPAVAARAAEKKR